MATAVRAGEMIDAPQLPSVAEAEIVRPAPTPEPAPAYEKEIPTSTSKESKDTVEGSDSNTTLVGEPKTSTEVEKTDELEDAFKNVAKHIICAFGPGMSLFFYSGGEGIAWKYVCQQVLCPAAILPSTLQSWSMDRVYDAAFSQYGAGYFAYDSLEGGCTWRVVGIKPGARPKKRKERKEFNAAIAALVKLKAWLVENLVSAQDIRTTKVRFGQGGRFMAWKPDGMWVGNDLPPTLQSELERRKKPSGGKTVLPQNMTFGLDNAWGAVWPDETSSLHLEGKYPTLDKYLQTGAIPVLLYVSLNCCMKEGVYFARAQGLADRYNMPKCLNQIVQQQWGILVRILASSLNRDLTLTSWRGEGVESKTILTAKQAEAAIEAGLPSVSEAKESEALAREAAVLSIESSKKSMKASKIAVGAGVIAIAAGCTVM